MKLNSRLHSALDTNNVEEVSKSVVYQRDVKNSRALFDSAKSSFSFFVFWKEIIGSLRFKMVASTCALNANEELIGGDEHRKIVMSSPSSEEIFKRFSKQICAVIDSQNPSRVLIGNYRTNSCTNMDVLGGIMYFDSEGKKDGDIQWFSTPVLRHDCRNGRPKSVKDPGQWRETTKEPSVICGQNRNMFLCGGTFIFAWEHRDMHRLHLSGAVFNGDDHLVSTFSFDTHLKGTDRNVYLHDDRWLCTDVRADETNDFKVTEHVSFDLKSFRHVIPSGELTDDGEYVVKSYDERLQIRARNTHMSYDILTVPVAEDVAESFSYKKDWSSSISQISQALFALIDVPSHDQTRRNGYPLQCANCGGKTVVGRMRVREGGGTINAGKGVCLTCKIHYSFSGGRWLCMDVHENVTSKMHADGHWFCCATVTEPHFKCIKSHAIAPKLTPEMTPNDDIRNDQNIVTFTLKVV